jgi:hypothetical protein
VPEGEVTARLASKGWTRSWLMGWRDITRTTDERTVIATVFPKVGVNHKVPLFMADLPAQLIAGMLSSLSSLVLDFVARQKVGGTSLTYFYLKQFPILPPSALFRMRPRVHCPTRARINLYEQFDGPICSRSRL